MYLLVLIQNNDETPLALFERIEDGRKFVQSIPGYRRWEEVSDDARWEYEAFSPSGLPDYMELSYNGNRVPITKFMFRDEDDVEIIWRKIPSLDQPGQGLVDSQTLVDAYVIGNHELKAYITKREDTFRRVKTLLEKRGYRVDRSFHGSEDGEAIVYQNNEGGDWHFLMHMDPSFVDEAPAEEEAFEQWLDASL